MKNGGKREGAGRKPGSKTKKTLEREEQLRLLQQMILNEIRPLFRSALDSAKGLTIMYQKRKVKNKSTGKYERTGELVRVMDQSRVEELLNGNCTGDDWYYITTKDPNVISIRELFDRAFGRPKEQIDFGIDKETLKTFQDTNKSILEIAKKIAQNKYNLS